MMEDKRKSFYLELVRDTVKDFEERMKDGAIKYTVSDLERLIRLEEIIQDDAGSDGLTIMINDKIVDEMKDDDDI